MQTAAVMPRPVPQPAAPAPPSPAVSAAYQAGLAAWFEHHKRYPESARARGAEGRGLLRMRVDRSGRLLDYALVQSTGQPDLDASIDQMMRGAVLPPFPPGMTLDILTVTVPVRFHIER